MAQKIYVVEEVQKINWANGKRDFLWKLGIFTTKEDAVRACSRKNKIASLMAASDQFRVVAFIEADAEGFKPRGWVEPKKSGGEKLSAILSEKRIKYSSLSFDDWDRAEEDLPEISTRLFNILEIYGIKNIDELQLLDCNYLKKLRGFGRTSLVEVRNILHQFGTDLKDYKPNEGAE